MVIFLERKKARADSEHRSDVVKKGDSLWSISQQFGVRMGSPANRNHLGDDNPLTVGMTLILR